MTCHSDREDKNFVGQFKDDANLQDEINPKRSARKVSRLLVVCSKVKNASSLSTVVHSSVNSVVYKYELNLTGVTGL